MTQDLTIEVQRREETGKSANRRLRREEMIPAVVYGGGKEAISIQMPRKTTCSSPAVARIASSCSSSPTPGRAGTR